jgi:radical SAM/Cys-rich protein
MSIKQRTKSLSARGSQLSDTFIQLEVLQGRQLQHHHVLPFQQALHEAGWAGIHVNPIEIFQVNIGKLCNQSCAHCHVDAGPDKKSELMSRDLLEQCLRVIASVPTIHTVDITGGAPEMNPHFRWFVEACTGLGKKVIDRCNLTIILANPVYHDLPNFFARHRVHVVSSLPYYSKTRTDSQRGDGVFEDSITAIQRLNEVGYGQPDSGLILDLVYNPAGAFLPGEQTVLEAEFKRQLLRKHQVVFNKLLTITNMPISRFLDYLLESGNYAAYMESLVNAFNPATLNGLMCRNTLSVSWEGYLYDCDFNQMLDLKVDAPSTRHIMDFDAKALAQRQIVVNQHCYGCTAGSGSSCGGAID